MKKVLPVALGIVLLMLALNCGGSTYRDCIDICYDRVEDCYEDADSNDDREDCDKEYQECTDWCASGCSNPQEKPWD